ncbi:MAG: cobaltochelatase subunit CobT, partial [Caulobacteraceae bacterium]|nr:cobaltochelatase subunit CobT [Caulobacteraceae bacterium]
MAAKSETPTETFKRALAHAARSLAEQPDLEITFSGDGPQLNGKHAILPHPPRDLSGKESARIRGLADQIALRIAHHNDAAHARLRPASQAARAVYEAVETARIEAIGANAMAGVRANLTAALEAAVQKKGLNRWEESAPPPLADIVSLMVRERLTGEAPPDGAKALVDRYRAEIEAKAGADLDRLAASLDDQAAFARVARAIIADLDLGEALSEETEPDEPGDDSASEQAQEPENETGESEQQEGESADSDDAEASDRKVDGEDQDEAEAAEDDSMSDSDDEADAGDAEPPGRPNARD